MKEWPILFSDAMVRALRAGKKTQTRRPLYVPALRTNGAKLDRRYPPPSEHLLAPPRIWTLGRWHTAKAGDRLWVREAHWYFKDEHDPVTGYSPPKLTTEDVEYRADGGQARGSWLPSIHMPRWACRLEYQLPADARVERLQSISEADAIAEGCHPAPQLRGEDDMAVHHVMARTEQRTGRVLPIAWPVARYAVLWDSLNGDTLGLAWDDNPWVVVLEFNP